MTMRLKKFRKKEIPQLTYGIIHSQFGMQDGVSIVMEQVEEVLVDNLHVPKKQIKYFVGKSGIDEKRITTNTLAWHKHPLAKSLQKNYTDGFTEKKYNYTIENVHKLKKIIKKWVEKEKIDVIIAHNTCHPVNFLLSLALSDYYQDEITAGNKTPKYMLWWHDSFLERERYGNPAEKTKWLLTNGVPGPHVEYIMFINSLQFKDAQKYFIALNERKPDFDHLIYKNHDVIYNTTSTFIHTFDDLTQSKNRDTVDYFLTEFDVMNFLKKNNTSFDKTLFCLQHTRVVPRKRIDFAIKYSLNLLYTLRKRNIYESMYFLVSGYSGDETNTYRKELEKLHKRECKKYGIQNHFLIFAEDFDKKNIPFEEYPRIFAKLGGISTYFSEIEGFGNNLLEVLASGLIPIVYTYPVFKEDIAKYKFKCILLDDFVIDADAILQTVEIITNQRKRKMWVNRNIAILTKHFQHKIIASKLRRGIIRKRTHI